MLGRISASTKARAVSRTRRFSSVRLKSITGAASRGRSIAGSRLRPTGCRPLCAARARSRARAPYTRPVDTIDSPSDALDLAALAAPNMSPVLGRYVDRSWSHGIGHRLYDTSGRAYLDFANGIAVTALGHAHPRVTAAIHAQVDRLIGPVHAIGFAESTVRLAAHARRTRFPDPLDTVLFLQLRLGGDRRRDQAGPPRDRAARRSSPSAGAFHGRTFGATSVTSSSLNYRRGYEPLLPSVYRRRTPPSTATSATTRRRRRRARMDAPATGSWPRRSPRRRSPRSSSSRVQGEGGYNPAPRRVPARACAALCDEHGILLIADEVQSGFGRTGKMWAFEHAGIVPDVVCVAKAIANGLPLSAIVTRRELQERWGRGAHGTTFGGNPVACAAGVAVLETIRDEEPRRERARPRRGARRPASASSWRRTPGIGDVRGPRPDDRRGVRQGPRHSRAGRRRWPRRWRRCADDGLLVLTCGIAPPGDPLDPAARRDGRRDRGGARRCSRPLSRRCRRRSPGVRPPARRVAGPGAPRPPRATGAL